MKYLLVVCLLGALLCAALAQEEPDSVNAYGKHGRGKKICKNCYKNKGSCVAANFKTCCKTTARRSCLGEPPSCYCDTSCHLLKDCCKDAHKIGCKKAIKKKKKTKVTKPTPPTTPAASLQPANPVPSSQLPPPQKVVPTTTPVDRAAPQPTPQAPTNPDTQPGTSTAPADNIRQSSTDGTPRPTNSGQNQFRSGLAVGGVRMKQHHFIMIVIVAVILLGILLILICQSVQCAVLCRRSRPPKQHLLRKDTIPPKKDPPAPGKAKMVYSSLPEAESDEENIYSEP